MHLVGVAGVAAAAKHFHIESVKACHLGAILHMQIRCMTACAEASMLVP